MVNEKFVCDFCGDVGPEHVFSSGEAHYHEELMCSYCGDVGREHVSTDSRAFFCGQIALLTIVLPGGLRVYRPCSSEAQFRELLPMLKRAMRQADEVRHITNSRARDAVVDDHFVASARCGLSAFGTVGPKVDDDHVLDAFCTVGPKADQAGTRR